MTKQKKTTDGFAEKYARLQELVLWFENDAFELEEGVKRLEEGAALVKSLKEYIQHTENTVKELAEFED